MRGRGIAVGEMNTELLYLNKSWEGLNSLPGTVKHTTCLHGRKTGHYHHLPPWLQALCGRGRGGGSSCPVHFKDKNIESTLFSLPVITYKCTN